MGGLVVAYGLDSLLDDQLQANIVACSENQDCISAVQDNNHDVDKAITNLGVAGAIGIVASATGLGIVRFER